MGEETFCVASKKNPRPPLEVTPSDQQNLTENPTNWRIFQRGKVKSTKKTNNLKNTPTEANKPPPRIDPDQLELLIASACVVPMISVEKLCLLFTSCWWKIEEPATV